MHFRVLCSALNDEREGLLGHSPWLGCSSGPDWGLGFASARWLGGRWRWPNGNPNDSFQICLFLYHGKRIIFKSFICNRGYATPFAVPGYFLNSDWFVVLASGFFFCLPAVASCFFSCAPSMDVSVGLITNCCSKLRYDWRFIALFGGILHVWFSCEPVTAKRRSAVLCFKAAACRLAWNIQQWQLNNSKAQQCYTPRSETSLLLCWI